jgi:hypothetical protein
VQASSVQPGATAHTFFKSVFLVAALYDGALGAVFFFFYPVIFATLGMQFPTNTSYIHLTAAFVFVQGVSYWFVFRDMLRNIDMVRVGAVYKGVYCLVAAYYWATGQLPDAIFAWFALFDVVFLALFIAFLVLMEPRERAAHAQAHSA